jgi:predicted metal-binding membrane protein
LQISNADKPASAGLFVAVGLYQFSPLKRACLSQCQRPFPFFFANWTEKRLDVFKMGLQQGFFCLGCCWTLMLLMFVGGAMNPIWMAALGMLMTAEKMVLTPRLRQAIGVGLVIIGVAIAIPLMI